MKKILAMLLALACVLSFAACASKKTDDTIGEEKPSTSEQMPTEPEAPTEEPDAPAEKPADDENAAKPDDGMLDDEFGVGEPSEENTPAAEGGTENAESTQEALDLLNKIWASYKDEEKFPAAGGDYDNSVDDAAGAVNIANADNLSYLLTFPANDAVKLPCFFPAFRFYITSCRLCWQSIFSHRAREKTQCFSFRASCSMPGGNRSSASSCC